MTRKTYIAVDVGGSGGVAWSNQMGEFVQPMPETRGDTIHLFRHILTDVDLNMEPPVAYIEKVVSYIPGGGQSTMFVYGANAERPGCILETLGVKLIEITPKRWQKELGLGGSERIPVPKPPKGYGKAQAKLWEMNNAAAIKAARDHNERAKRFWKNKLKAEAERRFPDLRVTLKTCDALLILEAAISIESGKLDL